MRPSLRISLRAAAAGFAAILAATAPGTAAEVAQPAPRKATQSESYVPIDPIYASILDGSRMHGLLLVEIGLDVPDAEFRASVNQVLPVLRDAYVRNLMFYAANAVRIDRQPKIDDVAGQLQTITDKTMGRKGARVLMAQLAIRLTQ